MILDSLWVKFGGVFLRDETSGGAGVVLPELTVADNEFAGIFAVPPGGATASIQASGAYTVDWGDGSTPTNHDAGSIATHSFVYEDVLGEVMSGAARYALIVLTMQDGETFTAINTTVGQHVLWRHLTVTGSTLTSMVLYATGSIFESASSPINAITNMAYTFFGCKSLTSIPTLDTSNATNMNSMFGNCGSLTTIPLLDTSNVTNMNDTFIFCAALTELPPLDMSNVTVITAGTFYGCTKLTAAPLQGTKVSHSFEGCAMQAPALEAMFAGLATVVDQTVTITGNPGAATCDRTIATAKGWTVTG